MGHVSRALACAGAITVVACATGGSDSTTAEGPGEGGVHLDASVGGHDATGPAEDTSTGDEASLDDASGDDSGDDASGHHHGGKDGGNEGGDDGGGGSCTYSDACVANATNLGTIPGDASGMTLTASGMHSEWLRVDLDETDSGIVGVPMQITATLSSPPGVNYDLYAYLGSGIGVIQCTGSKAQSNNPAGQNDAISFQWGDGTISNGNDDSATVMLEVRWVSGACSTGSWSISVQGG